MTYTDHTQTYSALPDPLRAPQFYNAVPMKRFIAWIIDTGIIVLLTLLIVPFTGFTALFILPFFFLLVGFAYRTLTITSGSSTWGMRVMSIELRGAQGEKFDFTQALLHTLGYSVSMTIVVVQVASIVCMLGSARGQSLTDMGLGSVMINRL